MMRVLRLLGLAKGTPSNEPESDEVLTMRREAHLVATGERLDRINAAIDSADELFEARKALDYDAKEKPEAKYQITRYDISDEDVWRPKYVKSDGYYVETWYIRQHGYSLIGEHLDGTYQERLRSRAYSETLTENALADIKQQIANRLELVSTYVRWRAVGAGNPFLTFEDAEAWLQKWLRPSLATVGYDAEGNRIENDAAPTA